MYESDHGLMSGDDGGHTAYSDLLCDERRRQRHQTGVITLLGYHHPILPNPSVPSNAALSAKRRRIRRKAAQYTTGILGASEMFQTHARESTTPQDVVMPNSASDDEEHTLDASNYHVPYLDADVNCWPVANGASCDVEARRPYPPIFDDGSFSSARHGHKRKREGAGRSLVTVLTRQNPVVRNVVAFKKLCALRKAAISVLLKGGGGGGVSIKTENVIDDSSVVVSPVKKEENLLATVSKGGSETQVNGRADQKEIGSSGCDILEIENCSQAVSGVGRASVGQGDKSEEHAMTRAVCALICAHSGVTHASESALEVLTDTVEMFIHEIGTILSTCRQNIDNNQVSVCKENNQRRGKTKDEVFEEMRIICSSGLRGGFAELYDYAKVSILKTEFAIKETMGKICQKLQSKEGGAVLKAFRNSVGRGVDLDMSSGLSEGGGEEEDRVVVREEDVSIEDEAFVFGYLHRSIWLDILDSIKVPRRLVFETGLETS